MTNVTQSLFIEAAKNKKISHFAKWSLKRRGAVVDGVEYPSAYEIYMSSSDEYEAAMIICDGDLRLWDRLCRTKWFMEGKNHFGHTGLNTWRKDMAARDASLAKRTLREEAEAGSVAAARALLADQKQEKKSEKPAQKDPMEAIRKHLAAQAKKGEQPLKKIDGGKS